MPSSVFFKFKSQREPTRVEFDGTGISVFELKRDIIIKSGLGDGTDFDLAIYSEDGKEEYDDDTTIIPRATVVTARRLPAVKPGAGKAARYVTGKMPGHAKNSFKKDLAAKDKAKEASASIQEAGTEQEKMQAMFQVLSGAWSAEKEDLSHEKPVFYNKPGGAHRPANVPDHDPPNGYICYRCGEKGHWIQMCPTNDDPEYDNRRRVKRTTGIPRSFLTTVDKSVALAQAGGDEEAKRPAGIMVNADGDFVIARPDKASWEKYQAKAKSSAAPKGELAEDKELRERGLACPADKKMFIEPMKTPCCGKTYCNDCITNALIESDFVCPACKAEGVLIDDLKPDDEVTEKIKDPPATSTTPAKGVTPTPDTLPTDEGADKTSQGSKRDSVSPDTKATATTASQAGDAPSQTDSATTSSNTQASSSTDLSSATGASQQSGPKKRPADELLENPKIPKAPRAMQQKMQEQEQAAMQQQHFMGGPHGMMGMPNMPGMPNMMPYGGGMNPMAMGMGMGMGMGMPNMGMPMGMPMMNNPMMNGPMNGGFPPMNGGGMFNGMMPMMNGGMNGNMNHGMNPNMNGGMMGRGMNGMNGGGMNNYQQQNRNFNQGYNNQYNNQNAGTGADDDDAYFRKPVNPHRQQNRQKRVRPSDYREL
ncbi:related to MPE1 Role in mRNA 3` end formation [Cephalotrichum gorgonifer]|uniref:Related to MPE1 Role in mRNA 3` end formation n=1 Tax=Cephalotrichum gorgonifer TaxID=2041049 RepID=A0AAE8SRK9_9PEZI|nr:related to MPE1 Role in mRNA 3` end formation [Cephalotrichum gorgonifer]